MTFNQLRIGQRIALLAGVLILGMVLMGMVAWSAQRAGAQQFQQQAERDQRFERAINLTRAVQVTFKVQIQEWKNILLRGGDPAAFDKYQKAFVREGAKVQQLLDELKPVYAELGLPVDGLDRAGSALRTLEGDYQVALRQFDPAAAESSARVVDGRVRGKDRPPTERIDRLVDDLQKAADAGRANAAAEAAQRDRHALVELMGVLGLSVALGGLLSWTIIRSIARPLHRAVDVAQDVAAGNLTRRMDGRGRDEVSQLAEAMGRMSHSLHQVVSQVRLAAQMVAHAATEIASGNLDLSSRTESQASGLQQTAATIEHLSRGVRHSAEHASQAQTLAARASDVAERGGASVHQMVQTMEDIRAGSSRMADIIGAIDGIAFQTNILALNAAVEAARAGEQGRGFAVVASEVRALAQRSAVAAQEIKQLIDDSVARIERGSSLAGDVGHTIAEAVTAVRHVCEVVADITATTRQQAQDIDQVSQTIGAMDAVMQQNAALVEEAAAAAASMQQQAETLQNSVAFFRT